MNLSPTHTSGEIRTSSQPSLALPLAYPCNESFEEYLVDRVCRKVVFPWYEQRSFSSSGKRCFRPSIRDLRSIKHRFLQKKQKKKNIWQKGTIQKFKICDICHPLHQPIRQSRLTGRLELIPALHYSIICLLSYRKCSTSIISVALKQNCTGWHKICNCTYVILHSDIINSEYCGQTN